MVSSDNEHDVVSIGPASKLWTYQSGLESGVECVLRVAAVDRELKDLLGSILGSFFNSFFVAVFHV
eukprot:CAMPEP_0170814868 /NCGR_PEP_ID=MMETSP0733-20121128/38006_1 /TAXON_ID=186038 /ORGANISM="Fragilariopsis kerguelensis, Strain L26-C5" /LENGTH=65 /DNA_ID=CAMNT_0011173091 /DNA_START=27 /DNA_END=221 /DNA_ORIENTATION=-